MAPSWLAVLAAVPAAAVAAFAAPTALGSRDCAPGEAHATFDAFVRAFNAGDRGALDRLVSPAGSFVWFSVGGPGRRLGEASKDRSTLGRYFAVRHAQRDQFRDVRWLGGGNARGYANFQFFLTRMADDELPSRYEGKGAVVCGDEGGSVAVWSMAHRSTLPVTAPPARLPPSGWHVGSTRVARAGCRGCVQTESWASTIPYRDPANQLPPHRTMADMGRGDLVVHVTRSWEPSPPAWMFRRHALRITRSAVTASFEGNTTGGRVSRWTATTWRSRSYVSVWVLFGRPTPTAAEIRSAQSELDHTLPAPWRIGAR